MLFKPDYRLVKLIKYLLEITGIKRRIFTQRMAQAAQRIIERVIMPIRRHTEAYQRSPQEFPLLFYRLLGVQRIQIPQ